VKLLLAQKNITLSRVSHGVQAGLSFSRSVPPDAAAPSNAGGGPMVESSLPCPLVSMSHSSESRSPKDPTYHTQQVRERLSDLIDDLRADIDPLDEPQAKALFEKAAETLGGLQQAFADYETRLLGKDKAPAAASRHRA
jgi:hypothetical protein